MLEYTSECYKQHVLPLIAFQRTTDLLLKLYQDHSNQENTLQMARDFGNDVLKKYLTLGEISHAHF